MIGKNQKKDRTRNPRMSETIFFWNKADYFISELGARRCKRRLLLWAGSI